jgi:hypothetical protein
MLLAALPFAALLVSADPAITRYDDLWKQRDEGSVPAEIASLSAEFAASSDYEKLWRAARWYHWVADDAPSDDERKRLGKAGWDVGERAKQLNPAGLEGKYWTSVDIGAYSEAVGVIKALAEGLEGKFRDPILEVAAADPDMHNPNLDACGPEMAIGRYYYKLPWPKHSDSKSKEWLARAIQAHPENLLAHYYLADTLKDHEPDAARREIGLVLTGSDAFDPPLARRVRRWARRLLNRLPQ